MKKLFTAVLLIASFYAAFAQALDNYKYVLVPSKFSFQKETDEHGLNTLIKLHLNKQGFIAHLDTEELPNEMKPMCARLVVDAEDRSTMFVTELQVKLKSCMGDLLYESPFGSSRLKDYRAATRQAAAAAFQDFATTVNYQYNGSNGELDRYRDALVGNEAKPAKNVEQPKVAETVKVEEKPKEVISPTTAIKEQPKPVQRDWWMMTATATATGYDLVENNGSKKLKLRKTSATDVFIATYESYSGTFHQVDGQWIFEYYRENQLCEVLVVVKL